MPNPLIEKNPRGLLDAPAEVQKEDTQQDNKVFHTQFPIHWLTGLTLVGWAVTVLLRL